VLDWYPEQVVAGAPSILALNKEDAKSSTILMVYHEGQVTVGTFQDKAIPLQAWTVAEVYRKLSLPDFKIIIT
jgi:hypothetical protein